jgi:hypothetical protein
MKERRVFLILGITDENSERSSTMSTNLKVVLIHI